MVCACAYVVSAPTMGPLDQILVRTQAALRTCGGRMQQQYSTTIRFNMCHFCNHDVLTTTPVPRCTRIGVRRTPQRFRSHSHPRVSRILEGLNWKQAVNWLLKDA